MPAIDKVLIKVASRCNINCNYCYVYNLGDDGWRSMPKQISIDTMQTIVNSLSEFSNIQKKPFTTILHGGEPLLLGAPKLDLFLATLRTVFSHEYPIGIQTNGILIDNEILDICSKHHTTIAVSLDGPKDINDRFRVDNDGNGTYEKVISGIQKLSKHPDGKFLFSGVLAVIDPQSDPFIVYKFFKDLQVPSVDLIHPDGNHTKLPPGKSEYHSTEYGEWLSRFFDVYLSDPTPIEICLLDNMIKCLLREKMDRGGWIKEDYEILVIDTDGTFSKNDILKSTGNRSDRFKEGLSVKNSSIQDLISSNEFLDYHKEQLPSSPLCLSCPELAMCGGGIPAHRWKEQTGFNNESIYCQDQKLLCKKIRKSLDSFCINTPCTPNI